MTEETEDLEREAIQASNRWVRPVIQIEIGQRHDAIDNAVRALQADPSLYVRNDGLVHVTRVTPQEALEFPAMTAGSPVIHTMVVPTLGERLTRYARWEKYDARSDKFRSTEPTRDIVAGVLSRGAWPGLRPLRGVIETPSLRPDGSVLDRPGYDYSTGYLYEPAQIFERVPEAPTLDDARAALQELLDVFVDFPFEVAAGASVAVAALLSLLARPAIRGMVPAFLFDAASPGTGKGLLTDIISMVAIGREAGKQGISTDARNADEEIRKVLATCAIRGARLVCLDNIAPTTLFGGPSLELALTAGTLEGRILGKLDSFSIEWRAVVIGTGNNVRCTSDMRRRTLCARLVSRFENPSRRPLESYRHPERAGNLIGWVRDNRTRLVRSCLTLLRAFVLAGAPQSNAVLLGGFEPWDRLISGAIVWAGGEDPTQCLLSASDTEDTTPDRSALGILLRDLPRLDGPAKGMTAKNIVNALWSTERIRGEHLPPDGFDDLREALEQLSPPHKPGAAPDTTALGFAFRKLRDTVVRVGAVTRRLQHPSDAGGKPMTDRTGVAKWVSQLIE